VWWPYLVILVSSSRIAVLPQGEAHCLGLITCLSCCRSGMLLSGIPLNGARLQGLLALRRRSYICVEEPRHHTPPPSPTALTDAERTEVAEATEVESWIKLLTSSTSCENSQTEGPGFTLTLEDILAQEEYVKIILRSMGAPEGQYELSR
jgi:hypothetical protein